jgi:hypothetical protein
VVPQLGSSGSAGGQGRGSDTSNLGRFHYGWVANPTNSLDSITYLYSHQLTDAVTDPEPGPTTGFYVPSTNDAIGDNVAANYSYRLNGLLVQSYLSQRDHAYIVPTGQQQNFFLNNGALTVNGDQLSNQSDTISVDVSGGGVKVTLNGEVAQFDPGAVTSITVNSGPQSAAPNTINVLRTPAGVPLTVNDNGSPTDTVTFGTGGSVQGIQGPVTLSNPLFYDTLTVDDSADTASHPAVAITANGITGLTPAALNFTNFSISTLTVLGGRGNNTYTVSGTPAATSVTLNTGGGADTVNVQAASAPLTVTTLSGSAAVTLGNAGSLAGLTAPVSLVTNTAPLDQVVVDDSADTANRANVVVGPGGITGLAPVALNFVPAFVSTLTVLGGSGNNTYTVTGTPAQGAVTLNTGGGADTVNVQADSAPLTVTTTSGSPGLDHNAVTIGNAGSLAGITADVTVFNQPSFDLLTIDDSADTADHPNVVIGAGGVTSLAPAALNFGAFSVSTLNVLGGSGNNGYTVAGTPAFSVMALNAGGGVDAVNIQATSAPLTVTATAGPGGGGADVVTFGNAGSLTPASAPPSRSSTNPASTRWSSTTPPTPPTTPTWSSAPAASRGWPRRR